MGMLTGSSEASHTPHIIGALLLVVGAVLGFVREQIKEEQLARAFEPKNSETEKMRLLTRLNKDQDECRSAYLEKKRYPPEEYREKV
jgi:hypothetical protein